MEAISPTPDDRTTERDDVRSTKEDLLQKISKVDREIAKAESQIAKLKKKQVLIKFFFFPTIISVAHFDNKDTMKFYGTPLKLTINQFCF